MLLEFIGNCHKMQYAQGATDSDALQINRDLATRKDTLTNHLDQATSCHPLDLDSTTGPGTDFWNRS